MHQKIILLLLISFAPLLVSAQVIYLNNPSFEGTPSDASVPIGWIPCNNRTTPDILPGPWGVINEPSDGNTFMGLITREDGTYESVAQRLKEPLKANDCYQFSLEVATSDIYADYNVPLKLRIWVGETRCKKEQLVLETKLIEDTEWEKYAVSFTAKKQVNYIILEAFIKEGPFSHRGNVLIDNFSPIKKCARASLE